MKMSVRTLRSLLTHPAFLLLFSLSLGAVLTGTAAAWELLQSEPNPFCDRGDAPQSTLIRFALDQSCTIVLTVLSPDSTTEVRTLLEGNTVPGTHTVIWDGHDDQGDPLPDGIYPYHLIARTGELPTILFEDTKLATISCLTPAEQPSWGRVKKHYR